MLILLPSSRFWQSKSGRGSGAFGLSPTSRRPTETKSVKPLGSTDYAALWNTAVIAWQAIRRAETLCQLL